MTTHGVPPPEIGRRRCRIPEHRKQIRAMQRWGTYLEAGRAQLWAQGKAVRLERDIAERGMWEARRALKQRRWGWFLAGVVFGFVLAGLAAGVRSSW